MLEVTLLKVQHFGERQARKLLPYIKNCDVFSKESFGLTEIDAKKIEKQWRNTIESNSSRTEVLRKIQDSNLPKANEYNRKVVDYLFRQRKPQFPTERWSDDRALQEMKRLAYEGRDMLCEGWVEIKHGNYEKGIPIYYEGVKKSARAEEMRDKNIAKNLERAEDILRKTHPNLTDEKIKLAMFLGGSHKPEDYTQQPIIVVSLIEPDLDYQILGQQNVLDRMIREGASIKEVKRILRENLS